MRNLTEEEFLALNGTEIGVSDWVLVDQERINRFAEATGDFQFIHVNPELARNTPFGSTIAHGFLTLSLFPMLAQAADLPLPVGMKMGVNYGGNRTRFLAPVKVGKRVRGRFKQIAYETKGGGQFQHTMEFVVEIEGEAKPALMAEWVTLYFV
ncbi:MaoC family dehydratase [Novosphingobium aquae]|uniref:MaoC family dehydratase n=1 Tax=Novosphingobium aquae TaxID=3133435 RepID=A0ABU8S5Z5_9SPHN